MQTDDVPKISRVSGNLSNMEVRYNQKIKVILKIMFSALVEHS